MERQKCLVYSRVVGYMSPISQWNDGKQAEYRDRKTFNINKLTKKECS
jgi:anaerobic ribonucleoside-triphosphate reductase